MIANRAWSRLLVCTTCLGLIFAVGCVRETTKPRLSLSTAGVPAGQRAVAPQRRAAISGPVTVAVMLQEGVPVPSVYSKEGLESVFKALQGRGVAAFRAKSWDDIYSGGTSVGSARADLAVVLEFHDIPKLGTKDQAKRRCHCAFSGLVVNVSTGNVLLREEKEYSGGVGQDFKEACLNAVLDAATSFAEAAARTIRDFQNVRQGFRQR